MIRLFKRLRTISVCAEFSLKQRENDLAELRESITPSIQDEMLKQGMEHPIREKGDSIIDEISDITHQLKDSPLQGKIQAWYRQREEEDERYEQRKQPKTLSQLQERESQGDQAKPLFQKGNKVQWILGGSDLGSDGE